MDAFFELVNGDPVFKEGVVMNIEVVRKIIRKDRGGVIEGDSDGRKKLMAKAELTYAWYMVNINSPCMRAGLEGQEAIDKAKFELNLPANWKADDLVLEFVNFYSGYHDGVVVTTIKQLISNFDIIYSSNTFVIGKIKEMLKGADISIETMASLMKLNTEVIKTASSIPDIVSKLKAAQTDYNNQSEDYGIMLGGNKIELSMMPNQ